VRWGVVGTGGIAATVSADLALTPGAVLQAVCSRDAGRAAQFARRHGYRSTHTDVRALAQNPDVDVVYVATPHASHAIPARTAIEAGTPVLVEKPFTASGPTAQALVTLAREQGVFCMEAMWTRFLPATSALLDAVGSGAIGEVRSLHASIGTVAAADGPARLLDPSAGGGALLDVGVYPLWWSHLLLGPVTSVAAAGELSPDGVDLLSGVLLRHERGGISLISATLSSCASAAVVLEGRTGRLNVDAPAWSPQGFEVRSAGGAAARSPVPAPPGRGYVPMLEHVQDCLAQGLSESPAHPLASTLAVMTVLDTALDQLRVVRAQEF